MSSTLVSEKDGATGQPSPAPSTDRPQLEPPELLLQLMRQSTDQRRQYCPLGLGKRWG